jgi:hypothetical protein
LGAQGKGDVTEKVDAMSFRDKLYEFAKKGQLTAAAIKALKEHWPKHGPV